MGAVAVAQLRRAFIFGQDIWIAMDAYQHAINPLQIKPRTRREADAIGA